VHVVGYHGDAATVTGVSAGAVLERLRLPSATLADPAGNPSMVCGSACAPGERPGGCNTVAQVLDYFQRTLGGTLRWSHHQYTAWTGGTYRASEGGCCRY
jgi:hypothetical protein